MAGAHGGCGPRALLCGPDGGALADACHSTDDASPFRLEADGALLGAWPEEGAPGGPPASDWQPDAGIGACPTGWRAQPDRTCDPDLSARCVAPAEAIPGGGCTALDECGASPWPDAPALAAGARALRVRAGDDDAVADGSERLPYGTLSRALEAARVGDAVLLAPGAYVAGVRVTRTLSLVGRCAARVALTATTGAVVRVASAGGVTLRGITLRGGADGLVVEAGARATLRASVVEAQTARGLVADGAGAALTAEDVVSRPGEVARPALDAVATRGGALLLRRASLRAGTFTAATSSLARSLLGLEDVSITGEYEAEAAHRVALRVTDGARLEATRVVVHDYAGGAFQLGNNTRVDTSAALVHLVARDLRVPAENNITAPLRAHNGAVSCAWILVERCRGFAAWVQLGNAARVRLTASVLRAASPVDATAPEYGVLMGDATPSNLLLLSSVRLEHPRRFAVEPGPRDLVQVHDTLVRRGPGGEDFLAFRIHQPDVYFTAQSFRAELARGSVVGVTGQRSYARLERSVLVGVGVPPPTAGGARGTVWVANRGAVELRQTRIVGAPDIALNVQGAEATARLEDSVVSSVTSTGDSPSVGVFVREGGTATVARSRIEAAHAGLLAAGARLTVEDSRVVGHASTAGAHADVGLVLAEGGRASVARTVLERQGSFGVILFGRGATLEGDDLVVRDVRGTSRVDGRPLTEPILGAGLVVTPGAAATLHRVAVTDARAAGLMTALTGAAGSASDRDPATLTVVDAYVRGVAASSLGATASQPSAPVAVGVHLGESADATLRRALLVDAGDGLVTLSPRAVVSDLVALAQRRCGVATGTQVADTESLARAVSAVQCARPFCFGEQLGDLRIPTITP